MTWLVPPPPPKKKKWKKNPNLAVQTARQAGRLQVVDGVDGGGGLVSRGAAVVGEGYVAIARRRPTKTDVAECVVEGRA